MSLCDLESRIRIYVGYGSTATVVPYANMRTNEKLDMTAATEVRVCVGGVMASSDDDPAYIWWEQDAEDETTWKIHFKPGMFAGVATGEQDAAIIVYSNTYPNGLPLTSEFPLLIETIC